MKARKFQQLGKQVAKVLDDGYSVKGPLMYKVVGQGEVLRGTYFEGSSFDSYSFYVWIFYLPLFVPATNISFNMGQRLRRIEGGDRWHAETDWDAGELAQRLLQNQLFIYPIKSVPDFISLLKSRFGSDVYILQALACSFARIGDFESLAGIVSELARKVDFDVNWQTEIYDRMVRLSTADAGQTRQLLDEWKAGTITQLRLTA